MFPQYVTDAGHLVSSCSVTLKSILMNPINFVDVWSYFGRVMLDTVVYVLDNSDSRP
jgi:hypothetical protein